MEITLEHLISARHEAYQKAFAGSFQNGTDVQAWRDANRAYVLARNLARNANRAALMPSVFIGNRSRTNAAKKDAPIVVLVDSVA